MVGLVIVSHSEALAKSVVELSRMMAPEALMAPAGGLEDGSLGTSFDRIRDAILSVYSDDGVLILMDMGSAVMTTEMVLEDLEGKNIRMADCPLVEGAVAASVCAEGGASLEEVLAEAEGVSGVSKLNE